MDEAIVEINGINMLKKFKALLSETYSVQPPELKSFYKEVPGADGSLDLSTAIAGRPTYERREITMHFTCIHPKDRWPGIISEILTEFHGKEGKIIFRDEPVYYYIGRMTVSDYERSGDVGKFTINMSADPYKYEILSSLEDWLWDTFDFETGIIREYGDIGVSGTETLMIEGTEKWVIPEFIVTGEISVAFEGKSHQLKAGTTKNYAIVIKPGKNELIFSGNGTVSVSYRGGVL